MRQKTKTHKIEKNNVNSKLELSWNSYALYYRLGMYIQSIFSYVTIIEKCHYTITTINLKHYVDHRWHSSSGV
jgi:hypothetical protein